MGPKVVNWNSSELQKEQILPFFLFGTLTAIKFKSQILYILSIGMFIGQINLYLMHITHQNPSPINNIN